MDRMSGSAAGRGRLVVAVMAVLVLAAAGCDWAQPRFGPERTGFNPFERTISAANVAQLAPVWQSELSDQGTDVIVTGGLVIVAVRTFDSGGAGLVTALDEATGAEIWTAVVPPATCDEFCHGATTTIASGNGLVFVAIEANGVFGTLLALDVHTGDLVRTYAEAATARPAVAGGRIYADTLTPEGIVLQAWDVATGATVFQTEPALQFPEFTQVAVGGGRVYDTREGLHAFDAAGVEGCSGTPVVCAPLWKALPTGEAAVAGEFVVLHSRVFAAGGCGAPTCPALWQGDTGNTPALAGGVLYTTNSNTARLEAYTLAGCGTPECAPLWQAPAARFAVPTVANGVVYLADGNDLTTYAAAGCGAALCPQLASLDMPGNVSFGAVPVVVNGRVLVALDDGTLVAFAPPAAT